MTGLAEVAFGEPSLVYCGDVKRIAADLRGRVESKPSSSGCTEETNAQKKQRRLSMLSVSIIKAGGDVVASEEVPELCTVLGLKRTLASKLNIHPIDQHLCTEARCGWKANCGSREVPEYRFGAEENVGVKVEPIDQHLVHGSNMLLEG